MGVEAEAVSSCVGIGLPQKGCGEIRARDLAGEVSVVPGASALANESLKGEYL